MSAKPKPKKQSGAESLTARGLVSVLVPLSVEERRVLKIAAAMSDCPVSEFARRLLVDASKKITGKIPRNPIDSQES